MKLEVYCYAGRIAPLDAENESILSWSQMRLVISRSRWGQIFRIFEERRPREFYLSGICMSGRYCVLGAQHNDPPSSRVAETLLRRTLCASRRGIAELLVDA